MYSYMCHVSNNVENCSGVFPEVNRFFPPNKLTNVRSINPRCIPNLMCGHACTYLSVFTATAG